MMKLVLSLFLMVVLASEVTRSRSSSLSGEPNNLGTDKTDQNGERRSLDIKMEDGIKKLKEDFKEMEKEMKVLRNAYLDRDVFGNKNQRTRRQGTTEVDTQRIDGGAVYIRWGHHECPSFSNTIYTGSAAAPNYLSPGGGADQLCLPPNPDYDNPIPGVQSSRSFLYGVEYQTYELENKIWQDIPCVVCEAPSRVSKLMIPARISCPSEWTLEYRGYLMAERDHTSHHRSLHICVDRAMQVLSRTDGYPAGFTAGLMNFVEGRCVSSGGGIPCTPYVDGYEITCAVCTK